MNESDPVVEVRGLFVDEIVAEEVADALNRWFAWIVEGSKEPMPEAFEPLGVDSSEYAWSLGDDVDWQIGPHARAVGEAVFISVETRDTYLRLSGLLRRLGARKATVHRGL